ncbi:MAG: arginine deiminase family protein [Pyrinomonadaceae bacterium]
MLRKAIVRPPSANFGEGLTTVDLGSPDYERALAQHEAYCAALQQSGLELLRLDSEAAHPDSTFVEDTAVLVKGCAILTRPGASSRVEEVLSIRAVLAHHYSELHTIEAPGTLDGGDVCEAADHFFIGVSERTNEPGARQLATLLASCGYSSALVDIRGVPGILHLKSGLAYLSDNRLAVIPTLAEYEQFRGYDVIMVASSEQYAANCICINDHILVAAGYPLFEKHLRELGLETIALEMSEFQKMDGGLSCLSLRF